MPADLSPTQRWQSLVPELPAVEGPADTAERLLLLLHYSIDWDTSWVADHRKSYWDAAFPSRVRSAAMRADTLGQWWTEVSGRLGATAPRQADRRMELAMLLGEPTRPVITVMRERLAELVLRVRIVAEAVAEQRKGQRQ